MQQEDPARPKIKINKIILKKSSRTIKRNHADAAHGGRININEHVVTIGGHGWDLSSELGEAHD